MPTSEEPPTHHSSPQAPILPPYPPDTADPAVSSLISNIMYTPYYLRSNYNCPHCTHHSRFSVESKAYEDSVAETSHARIYLRCRACKKLCQCAEFGLVNLKVGAGVKVKNGKKGRKAKQQTPQTGSEAPQAAASTHNCTPQTTFNLTEWAARDQWQYWQRKIAMLEEKHKKDIREYGQKQAQLRRDVEEKHGKCVKALEKEHKKKVASLVGDLLKKSLEVAEKYTGKASVEGSKKRARRE